MISLAHYCHDVLAYMYTCSRPYSSIRCLYTSTLANDLRKIEHTTEQQGPGGPSIYLATLGSHYHHMRKKIRNYSEDELVGSRPSSAHMLHVAERDGAQRSVRKDI